MVRTENISSTKKVYAYRRITATPAKEPVVQKLSYLYIGKKFKSVLDLHAGFETSYFLFSFQEALKLLGRLDKAGQLPSVILIDAAAEIPGLKVFLSAIAESEIYKNMLVFAEVGGCSETQLAELANERIITDLVRVTKPETLAKKIAFHGKLAKEEPVIKKQLNLGINWQIISRYGLVRAFDLVFSSISIILLSPLMLLLAIMVKMDGGNSIFEFSTETGLRYRSFRYIRFRTELAFQNEQLADLCHVNQLGVNDHDRAGYQFKSNETSKVGSFLRATNLDSLPALFNILIGDISFIKSR